MYRHVCASLYVCINVHMRLFYTYGFGFILGNSISSILFNDNSKLYKYPFLLFCFAYHFENSIHTDPQRLKDRERSSENSIII